MSVLWIQVKDIYGYGITLVASKFVAEVKDVRLERLEKQTNSTDASFIVAAKGKGKSIYASVLVKGMPYPFGVPLTLSLLVSLFPFIKRKQRAYTEALVILLLFNLVHVFLWETLQLTKTFMSRGVENESVIMLSIYQILFGLAQDASMSFAPFLIAAYVFVKFRN